MVNAKFYYENKGDIKYLKQFYASACRIARKEYDPKRLKFLQGKVAVLTGQKEFIEKMVQYVNVNQKRTGITAMLADD